MTDLNPYALMDVFSDVEAVQAITGIVKPKTPEEKNIVELVSRQLQRDIDSKELKVSIIKVQGVRQQRLGMRRISVNDTTDHRPIVEHPYTETIIRIARADLLAWCESHDTRPPLLFPDSPANPGPVEAGELSNYHTPALDALRAAVRHFWLNHDPLHPPKSSDVVDWLVNNHVVSPTAASEIDRIIRPGAYRTGGNRRIK